MGRNFQCFFSVRSAYKVALELVSDKEVCSCSNENNLCWFWKKLWSIQIPYKIRHFAWRATRDILATKENLVRRKVLLDSVCDECSELPKSFLHLFWVCPKARETWDCSSLCNPMTSTSV